MRMCLEIDLKKEIQKTKKWCLWKMMLIKSCQVIGDIFSEKWILLNESKFWIIKHVLCTDDFYIVHCIKYFTGFCQTEKSGPWPLGWMICPWIYRWECFSLWIVKVIDSLSKVDPFVCGLLINAVNSLLTPLVCLS